MSGQGARRARHPFFGCVGSLLGTAALLLTACGPAAAPTSARDSGGSSGTGPKTLNVALQEEPVSIVLYGRQGEGGTTSARFERFFTFHANLTMFDRAGNVIPHTAEKVPSVEDGDWKVNSDNTMEVTWRIRPDVYWHDGMPLTAEDFGFGFEVVRDPKLAVATLGEVLNMSGVRVVDPKTFVVSWKKLSIHGNTNSTEGVPAIARHQMEDPYRAGDTQAFEASQGWRAEYVGLGPFRLSKWELGSHMEAEAFDQYFLGRPKIDRLVMRWVADINVLTANVLSGVIDLVPPGTTIKPEQMAEIKRQWGPDGGQAIASPNDIRAMALNFRIEGQPWDPQQAGWQRDVRFRQAMLHSINKQQLVEVLQYGFTEVAHYFGFPEDAVYRLAEQRGLTMYVYDPTRAQQLFAEAGWTRGSDGLLRNSAGQTVQFPCCRYADADSNDIRESLAWGTDLKAVGLDVIHPIPAAPAGLSATERRRVQTVGWGGSIGNFRVTADQKWATFVRENIGREETRWSGINSGAWTNPAYEETFARAMSTLGAGQRREIEFQLLKIAMEELPRFPVYYNPLGLVIRKGVEGVAKGVPLNRGITWNIHTWDLKR